MSLKNQTYKHTELIVADGYSKDKTINIAKEFGARIIYAQELVEARFLGMKEARGKYLFAFDSDQMIKKITLVL
jgi:glycosyltransferase involved in cell wall biosynthesis